LKELAGVRALGWWLECSGIAQVSMNLTMPEQTPLPAIFDYVRAAAEKRGIQELWSEVVGLIPRSALGGEPPERIQWRDFKETQILEYWIGNAVT
jgi:glutamate formiminotransferase